MQFTVEVSLTLEAEDEQGALYRANDLMNVACHGLSESNGDRKHSLIEWELGSVSHD